MPFLTPTDPDDPMQTTTDPTMPCGCSTTDEHAAVDTALNDPARFADPTTVQPATPGQLDLDAIEARAEAARQHVYKLCSGEERWTLRVPAQPERDSDFLLDTALGDIPALLAEVRRLTGELEAAGVYQLPAEPDGPLWDSFGYRWSTTPDDVRPYLWWCDNDSYAPRYWRDLLLRGPLSTTRPAGTGGER